MRALPWDDMKVAFGFDGNEQRLCAAHDRGDLPLPAGWTLAETDCAGARMVVVFRVEIVPTIADAYAVKRQLRRFR